MDRTKLNKGISIILCIALILEFVFSESVAFSFAVENDDAAADANVVYEEEDIVEEGSDYTIFSNEDGTETLVTYTSDVRTMENGHLVDIDNSIEELGDDSGYRNVNGFTDVILPETIDGESQIEVTDRDNGKTVSFIPVFSRAAAEAALLANSDDEESDDEAGTPLSELSIDEVIEGELENLLNETEHKEIGVRYETPDPNVYMEYMPIDSGVKESIILEDVPSSNVFSFVVKCEGQVPETSHKGIIFRDKKTGEELGAIQEPYMEDSSDEEGHGYSEDLEYSIESLGNDSYRIDLEVSEDYLLDEERVYPVTIDPTYTANTSSTVKDAYVLSAHAGTNYFSNSVTQMCVGRGKTDGVARTYVQFPSLQSNISGKYIESATFKVTERSNTKPFPTLGIYRLTASFSPGSVTWNNKPGNYGTVCATSSIKGSGSHTLTVTDLVRGWAAGSYSNYGIVLKATSEAAGTYNFVSFYGSRFGTASSRPVLTVTYTVPSPSVPSKPDIELSREGVRAGDDLSLNWSNLSSNILNSVQVRIVKKDETEVLPYTATGSAASSGSYSINTSLLTEGEYTIYVRGVDKLNHAGTEEAKTFYIDETAPGEVSEITVQSERMSEESDLAKVNVSFNPAEDSENGSGIKEYLVQLYDRDNNSTIGDVVRTEEPSCSFENIDPGKEIYVKIRAVDKAGNEGEEVTSEIHTVIGLSLPKFNRRGSFEPEADETVWITEDNERVRVSWKAEYDSEIPKVTAEIVREDGTSVYEAKEILKSESSLLSYDGYCLDKDFELSELSEGRYRAVFRFYGSDGTGYTCKEVNFGVDNTAPVIHDGENGTMAVTPAEGAVLRNTTQIAYDCEDAGSGLSETKVEIFSSSGTKVKTLTESQGIINLDTLDYDDGEYTIKIKVTDRAGNSSELERHIEILNPPPTPKISLGSDVGAVGAPAVLNWEYVAGDETASKVAGLEYAVMTEGEPSDGDFREVSTAAPSENGTAEIPVNIETSPIETRAAIYVRAVDSNGGKGKTRKLSYIIDSAEPGMYFHSPQEDTYVTGLTEIYGELYEDHYASHTLLVAEGDTENPSLFRQLSSYSAEEDGVPWDYLGTIDFSGSEYVDGNTYTIMVEITDKAGHTGRAFQRVIKHTQDINEADFSFAKNDDGRILGTDEICSFPLEHETAGMGKEEYIPNEIHWYIDGIESNRTEWDDNGNFTEYSDVDLSTYEEGSVHRIFAYDRRPDGTVRYSGKNYMREYARDDFSGELPDDAVRLPDGSITAREGSDGFYLYWDSPDFHDNAVSLRVDVDADIPAGEALEITYYNGEEPIEIPNHTEKLWDGGYVTNDSQQGRTLPFFVSVFVPCSGTEKPVVRSWSVSGRVVENDTMTVNIADSFDVSNVHAEPKINRKVLVTWDESENADDSVSYEIYRSTSPDFGVNDTVLLQEGVKGTYYYDNYLLVDKYANANNPEGNTASVRNVRARNTDNFYYKVVAVKKYESNEYDDAHVRKSRGKTTDAVQVLADNEYSKRLGIKDYLGYSSVPFGAGTAHVEQSKGNLVYEETDGNVKGRQLDISLDRVYNSMATGKSPFGYSWDMSLNPVLLETYDAYGDNTGIVFKDGTGSIYTFLNIPEEYGKKEIYEEAESDDTDDEASNEARVVTGIETHYKSPLGVYIHLKKIEEFDSTDSDNDGDVAEVTKVSYIAETLDGETYTFNQSSQIEKYRDANGNEITYTYDEKGRIVSAENLNGKTREEAEAQANSKRSRITFTYSDSEGRDPYLVDTAILPNGTMVKYEYDNGYLVSSDIMDGGESLIRTEYSYNGQEYLNNIKDPNGNNWRIGYTEISAADTTDLDDEEASDYSGIARTLVYPTGDGRKFRYHPSDDEDLLVDQTDEISFVKTSALGITHDTGTQSVRFNSDGNIIESTDAEGAVVESEYMMGLEVSSKGNVTAYSIDDDGYINVSDTNEVRTKTVYDVIPDNNTLAGKIGDTKGNVKKDTDIAGNETRIKYEAEGKANQSNPTSIVTVPENGKATHESFTYDESGNLLTAKDEDTGDTVTYTYSDSGEVLTETFSNDGNTESVTAYSYDEAGNIISEAETGAGIADSTERYRYDDFGNVIRELNANGYALEHVYDILGREIETKYYTARSSSIDNLNGSGMLTERRTYDRNGNLVSETDRSGRTTSYVYDKINRVTEKTVSDGTVSKTWRYSYSVETSVDCFFESGTIHITYPSVETVTSPDGDLLSKVYRDKAGNIVKTIENGTSSSFKYNRDGEITEMFVVGVRNGLLSGEPTEEALSNGETVLANYSRYGDNTSNIVNPVWDEAEGKYRVGEDTLVYSYEYDTMGNVLEETDPLGHRESIRYDSSGRLERAVTSSGDEAHEKAVTKLKYDIPGTTEGNRIARITNAENMISETEEDASGNTVRITDYGYRKDSHKIEKTFTFDALGNMTSETDGNGTTYYSYDDMNNMVRKVTDGTLDNPLDYSDYTYDYDGNVTERKDYEGGDLYNVALFEYDYLKRLRKYYEGAEPQRADDGAYQNVDWIEYDYDIEDNLTEITYPSMTDLDSVEYTYGDFKRVDEVRVTDNGTERLARKYGYDPNGRVAFVKDYSSNTNYLQKDFSYDSVGRCTEIRVTEKGNQNRVLENYSYTYDRCSNILSEEMMNRGDETSSSSSDSLSDSDDDPDIQGRISENGSYHIRRSYTYNDLNALTECAEFEVADDGTETQAHVTTYEFDRIGNRTVEVSDGVRTEYTYDEDGLNLLVSESTVRETDFEDDADITYSYDNAGNLTEVHDSLNSKTTVYEYNSKGMMSRATVTTENGNSAETVVTENVYNGEGHRIAKKLSGKTTHYVSVSGSILFTYVTEDGGDTVTVTSENVAGIDGQVFLTKRPDDSWYIYSNDLRGSVTAIADSSCNYILTCFYDIYGEPEIWRSDSGGNIYNEIYYTGAIYDETTGLYYLSSRYYDSSAGRFTTMDSVRGDAKNPLSLNPYGYCEGNPVNNTDYEGENPVVIGMAIVGAVVGGGMQVIDQVSRGQKINWGKVALSSAAGALSGAIAGVGITTTLAGGTLTLAEKIIEGSLNFAINMGENTGLKYLDNGNLTKQDRIDVFIESSIDSIASIGFSKGADRIVAKKVNSIVAKTFPKSTSLAKRCGESVKKVIGRKLKLNRFATVKRQVKLFHKKYKEKTHYFAANMKKTKAFGTFRNLFKKRTGK